MKENTYALPEVIDFENVQSITQSGLAFIQETRDPICVDGGQIKRCNSAIFLVFFEWLRTSQKVGVVLSWTNMPSSLKSMAVLYGVDTLFSL